MDPPSLLCLCLKAFTSLIIHDVHQWKYLDQLPLDLFADVLLSVPPIVLQALQEELLSSRLIQCSSNCALRAQNRTEKRKRARTNQYQDINCERIPIPSSSDCLKQLNEYEAACEEERKRERTNQFQDISYKRISISRSSGSLKQLNDHKAARCKETVMNLQTCFSNAWKDKFRIRWPEGVKQTGFLASFTHKNAETKCEHDIDKNDWQQSYWEAHLQDCLREGAAKALVPSYEGSIAEILVSGIVLEHIGFKSDLTWVRKDFLTLRDHCEMFGHYARHLRLRNVLCVEELCDILRNSRLQGILFQGITSEKHIEGACKILNWNRETLEAVELLHCRISSSGLSEICASLICEGSSMHNIQYFSVMSSRVLINDDFLQFLSSGRYLHSLKLCDNGFEPKTGGLIFNALCQCDSDLSVLELCDNKLSGWLSWQREISPHFSSLPPNELHFLRSLTTLNLRGNFLESKDVEILKMFLQCMPQLQNLDLSDNPIGDSGVRTLIPYFQEISERDKQLVDVKIANCNITFAGASSLFDSLSTFKRPLYSLAIAHNGLGSSIATSLANFLKKSHVERLDIGGIGLGPTGYNQLQEAISYSQDLVYLNMRKNHGGLAAATMLSKLISHSNKISVIDASYNFLCLKSLELIATALKQSKGQIKCVDLRGNRDAYLAKLDGIFDEFHLDGKPIVILPSSVIIHNVHDDDP